MNTFKQQILRYWLAMNEGAIRAAAQSVMAFFGLAGVHTAVDTIPALNLKQAAAVFGCSFMWSIFNYLATNPLPTLPPTQPDKPANPPLPATPAATQSQK